MFFISIAKASTFSLSCSAFFYFPHIPCHKRLSEPVVTENLKTDWFHMPVLIVYSEYLELTEIEIYPLRSLSLFFIEPA